MDTKFGCTNHHCSCCTLLPKSCCTPSSVVSFRLDTPTRLSASTSSVVDEPIRKAAIRLVGHFVRCRHPIVISIRRPSIPIDMSPIVRVLFQWTVVRRLFQWTVVRRLFQWTVVRRLFDNVQFSVVLFTVVLFGGRLSSSADGCPLRRFLGAPFVALVHCYASLRTAVHL